MIDRRLKLLLPSQPQSLTAIREEVQDIISGTDYEERGPDILVVSSEACTNVVRHAYAEGHIRPVIGLECTLDDASLKLMVRDKGKGLTYRLDEPVFSEEGGFGLFLMEKLSDGFECYSSPGFGTVIEALFKNPKRVTAKGRAARRFVGDTKAPTTWKNVVSMVNRRRKDLSGTTGERAGCKILFDDRIRHYI
ncbi:MAG: ATP-binding protein [Candidatus Aquicultor sp.]|nr:ATP-binding protein [Candidatus Aquicultor sp.]